MKLSIIVFLSLLAGMMISSFEYAGKKKIRVESGIEWSKSEYNFGRILRNHAVSVAFEFKNPSMVPLFIMSVEPSCGCTVANYPKEPIKAGQKAEIKITFDAKDTGHFKKSIAVISNASQSPSILYITGEVVDRLE